MPDVERLGSQLDSLEDALEPLLGNLSEMSSQLPLLDRAKLFSMAAYAIESLLFCEFYLPHTIRAMNAFGSYSCRLTVSCCSIFEDPGS